MKLETQTKHMKVIPTPRYTFKHDVTSNEGIGLLAEHQKWTNHVSIYT